MSSERRESLQHAPAPNANQKMIDQLILSIRRRETVGSAAIGVSTAVLVHSIIRSGKYSSVDDLISQIKHIGRALAAANPKGTFPELACPNIIRRTLKLIREEYRAAAAAHLSAPPSAPETPYFGPITPGLHAPANHYLSNDLQFGSPNHSQTASPAPARPSLPHTQTSLSNFVAMRHSRAQNQLERTGSVAGFAGMTALPLQTPAREGSVEWMPSRSGSLDGSPGAFTPQATPFIVSAQHKLDADEFARQSAKLRPVLLQAIEEVINELESTHEDVAKGAKDHIHPAEVILTLGHSRTVEQFLKQAARDRNFQVIIAETTAASGAADMAESLASAGIEVVVVPDTSIHAIIPRITKLVLGCHTVLANGGLFGVAGSLAATLAAHSHAKPVVVPTGQYKFAPAWNSFREHGAVDYQSPAAALSIYAPGPNDGEDNETIVAFWDYVRPELVDLYVTNEGDHAPSHVYRLIKEAYDDEDQQL